MSSNRNATVTVNTKANTSGIKKTADAIKGFDSGLKGTIGNMNLLKGAIKGLAVVGIAKSIVSFADDMRDAYLTQWKAEKSVNDSLYSNMKARGESQQAIDNEVKAYKDLASSLQDVGVIGDEVTLSGMGVMTQMGLTTEQVKTMTPLLQDLAVKQYGLNTTSEQFTDVSRDVATMVNMGKLSLQKYGIQVTDVEKKQFKAMNQSERFAFINNKLANSVKGANEAMAQTAGGKAQQMTNAIGDCEERVGELVNKIYGGLAVMALPVIKDVTGKFQELSDILSGVDAPEGGYKFFTQEQADTIAGIRDGLSEIWSNIQSIVGGEEDIPSGYGLTDVFLGIINNIVWAVKALSAGLAEVTQQLANLSQYSPSSLLNGAMQWGYNKVQQLKGQANGTNYWQGGKVLVGEYGPELVDLPRGASINTNAQTQRELSGGSNSNVTVNLNISGNVIDDGDFIDRIGQTISSRVSLAIANM